MKPNPYLVVSSTLFVIPTTLAAKYKLWNIYAIFMYITIVSSLYHATKYPPLLYLDYPGCYTVILVLGYEKYKINKFTEFVLYYSVCGILFWGGYFTKRLVFSENQLEQTLSHITMHFIVIVSGVMTTYEIHKYNNKLLDN